MLILMLGLCSLILSRGKYLIYDLNLRMINIELSSSPDTHVTILPEFTVPAGRMADFQVSECFPKYEIIIFKW